jgi:hypothetical protein
MVLTLLILLQDEEFSHLLEKYSELLEKKEQMDKQN